MLKNILNLKGAQKLSKEEQKKVKGMGPSFAEDLCVANIDPTPFGDGTTNCCPAKYGQGPFVFTNGMTGKCKNASSNYFWFV